MKYYSFVAILLTICNIYIKLSSILHFFYFQEEQKDPMFIFRFFIMEFPFLIKAPSSDKTLFSLSFFFCHAVLMDKINTPPYFDIRKKKRKKIL